MEKKDMILKLTANGEFNKNELKKMKSSKFQSLFDKMFALDLNDEIKEIKEVKEEEVVVLDLNDEIKEVKEEEVKVDISSLSTVEQRTFRRTGILPKIKVKKYDRFEDEEPKMNN